MNKITNLDNGGQQESLVKIIRAKSIGGYSWDTSLSEINSGFGINEWSQADVMKLLNPQEVYSGTPVVGGSLYWNNGSGNCYYGQNEVNKPCDFTSSGLSEEAKKKIAKVKWNTGTIGEVYDSSKITAKYMYEAERSIHNGKEQCESIGENACNDEVPRTTTWDGYIGLLYPSDYGYAVGGDERTICLENNMAAYSSVNCIENIWLKQSNELWTITPVPLYSNSYHAFYVLSSGDIGYGNCVSGYIVLPVAYLKSNVKIATNLHPELEYGSVDNPFILE